MSKQQPGNNVQEHVILVNEHDEVLGLAEKLEVHKTGALHRALSVFVFNAEGDLLLQKRAAGKYHSGGLYSNTCCSHPRPGETTEQAAHRRLMEEMGFDCPLTEVFSLHYKVQLGALYEHEYDHIFIGQYENQPTPNPAEVSDWRWASAETVARELDEHPETYTSWFYLAFLPTVMCWSDLHGKQVRLPLYGKKNGVRHAKQPVPALQSQVHPVR